MSKPTKNEPDQVVTFRKTARALDCDEDAAKFDAALGKVARHKPIDPQKLKKLMDDPDANLDEIAREIGNKTD